ncbi:MAG TPA: DUF4147 domain-containing protein [Planctomycetaceae bacterium]|nr:DUF4147 domain-containing protein [Planctomycetaceae bacterium]
MRGIRNLRPHAEDIWRAGVAAVDSDRLVTNVVRRRGEVLDVCGHELPLAGLGRIAVVGAGKAGAGMAAAFERAVGEDVLEERVCGWVNVPADCVRPLRKVQLHAARPAGVNEPTADGVAGALEILALVSGLERCDVCIVLLSGGGSALLPAPVDGISLDDKQAVTRFLMQTGATIGELNCVRKQLSRIKGGGLARAARAGRIVTLIISDVIGDPLDVIASGPTVADASTAREALAVLEKHDRREDNVPAAVWSYLRAAAARDEPPRRVPENVSNHVIGNNACALEAAAARAKQLGYRVHSLGSGNAGEAAEAGRELAELCRSIRDDGRPLAPPACVLSGGEPVVHLAAAGPSPIEGGVPPVEAFAAFLSKRGKRLTTERRIVADEVFCGRGRFDREQIVERLSERRQARRVSRATVYRALSDLEQAGLIRSVSLDDGRATYQCVSESTRCKGGRNQELVLAAVVRLWDDGLDRMAILSGGTDGEDGPTDAAGAVADADVLRKARALGLDAAEFLASHNSYPFFDATGGLLRTGPTHTNVMDLRVGLIG